MLFKWLRPNRTPRWHQLTALAILIAVWVVAVDALAVSLPSDLPTPSVQQPGVEQPVVEQSESAEAQFERGVNYYRDNQLEAAIAAWQLALEQYRVDQNVAGEGRVLGLMTVAHLSLGNYRQVLTFAEQTLAVAQGTNQNALRVSAYANLGIAHSALGDYIAAINAYQNALTQTQDRAAPSQEAHVLGLLANAYEALGNYERAVELHQQSLSLAQQAGSLVPEATARLNLGATYARLGDYDEAIAEYKTSLDIFQTLEDPQGLAYVLNNLGAAYYVQGDFERALVQFQEALTIARASRQPDLIGAALGSLGSLYADLGDYPKALEYHEQSLEIATTAVANSIALNNLGHTLYASGQLDAAAVRLNEAIVSLESLRPGLDDANQISLFDTHVLTYNLLQQVLVAQGKVEAALEVAERGRARAFVELVASRTDASAHPEQDSLVSEAPSINQIRQIARAQQATLVEYTLIPDDSFRFQGKQRGTAASLYIWVVQPSGEVDFRQVELKPILQEKDLTLTRLVETARDRSGIRGGSDSRNWATIRPGDQVRREGDLPDLAPYEVVAVDPQAGTVTVSHPEIFLPNPVLSLSEVTKVNTGFAPTFQRGQHWQELHQLMIEPIADLLPSDPSARVVFIPQEQLFLVPFPALQAEDGSYLVEHHTILTAPAIQILALTAESSGQPAPTHSPTPHSPALIVGDPSPMPQTLPQLPHSATEASGIAEILATTPLIGEVASEAAVKQQLSTARLIHLATHGFFNESNPLQGSLALVPSENEDGFLTAEEVLGYPLSAELVVLSACDTGRGEITGDGVIGLSRSFIAAGADNVLVSLWQVPDDATSELMIEFYRQRQGVDNQPIDNAQALRQAMLATMAAHPDPNDWAAFTLIGAVD